MNNNYKIVLEALIDDSSLSDIQKRLAKERLKISADIELTSFSKNKADLEKQFKELSGVIKKTLGDAVSDQQAAQWARNYYDAIVSGAQLVIKEQKKSNQAAKDTISLQKDVTSVLNQQKEIYAGINVSSHKEGKISNIQDSVKAASELSKVVNTLTKSMSFLKSLGLNIDLFPGIKNVGRQNGAKALSNV